MKNSETSSYEPPISPIKIPKGDKGFALTKKNYRRFLSTWEDFTKQKPNLVDVNKRSSSVQESQAFMIDGDENETLIKINFPLIQDWLSRNFQLTINPRDLNSINIPDEGPTILINLKGHRADKMSRSEMKKLQNGLEEFLGDDVEDVLLDIYKKKIQILPKDLNAKIKINY
jgi:hypothetical protein